MTAVHGISDPKYVSRQYRDASNLNVRLRLHQEFSTNPQGWHRWLFEQIQLPRPCRVLELGCGTGSLWAENQDRLPEGAEITLSDLSAGMVTQAQENLRSVRTNFGFAGLDAQSIPFQQGTFDVVIASHMLYHVPDREKALGEITRVLKPDGVFYASTVGLDHLKELKELAARFDEDLLFWGQMPADSFHLGSGAQLSRFFAQVSVQRYPDSLVVTDAPLLTAYMLSGRIDLSADRQEALAAFVAREMEAHGGQIVITKDSGVFAARGSLHA